MRIRDYVNIQYVKGGRDLEEDGGLDCYGLVRHVYYRELNIELPKFELFYSDGRRVVNTNGKTIDNIHDDFQKQEDCQMYDILLFSITGDPMHMGIVIDDKRMLHAHRTGNSVVEVYDNTKWKNRMSLPYRHKEMMNVLH